MLGFKSLAQVTFSHDRRALMQALLAEEQASRPRGITGPPKLRVSETSDEGKPGTWWLTDREQYGLRCVLQNETVADVGDHTPWHRTVRDTHALWDVANRWRVPYWGALTGGSGTHTHVFLPPGFDRAKFVKLWVWAANELVGGLATVLRDGGVTLDPVTITPAHEARQLREFGAERVGKDGRVRRKTLWTVGPGPYRPLPLNREYAYDLAGVRVPTVVPRAEGGVGILQVQVEETWGVCPRSASCLLEPGLDGLCSECPATS